MAPRTALSIAIAFAALTVPRADEAPPVKAGLRESVKTELVLLDVFVLDRKGNAVPGLAPDDFELTVGGRPVPLVSVDATCGVTDEKPKVAILFDYQHLAPQSRARAVEMARNTVARRAAGSTVMVAALTGSLQVEQTFARDPARIDASLARMENDARLFAGDFGHLSEDGFVRGLTSLFDSLATVPGPKAVLLYSEMKDVPLDEQFRQLSAQAAAARCAVYPIDVRGLISGMRTRAGSTAAVGAADGCG